MRYINELHVLTIWLGFGFGLLAFTFMHLADAFIQSDLQLHSGYTFFISMCVPWESNPQPLSHRNMHVIIQFNSRLFSAFYDTIVAKQLYRKLSF